jgi:hypothetical protein
MDDTEKIDQYPFFRVFSWNRRRQTPGMGDFGQRLPQNQETQIGFAFNWR